MATQLTKNFTLEELIATSKKADNTPTSEVKKHLQELAELLQTLRDQYGKPIRITSGYRGPKVNALVGGSKTSAHMCGYAADTQTYNGNMKEYQKVVLEWAKTHDFDQIIIEYPINYVGRWIHIGIKNKAGLQRKQILYTVNGRSYPAITKKFYLE